MNAIFVGVLLLIRQHPFHAPLGSAMLIASWALLGLANTGNCFDCFLFFLPELKGPVGQMIQTDNRGLLAVEKNKVRTETFF